MILPPDDPVTDNGPRYELRWLPSPPYAVVLAPEIVLGRSALSLGTPKVVENASAALCASFLASRSMSSRSACHLSSSISRSRFSTRAGRFSADQSAGV